MGNGHVQGAVRKMAGILEDFQEIPNHSPGNMLRGNILFLEKREIRFDIGLIAADGIRGKIFSLKHFDKKG